MDFFEDSQPSDSVTDSRFSETLVEIFEILSQVPDLFQLLCDSIFPNITGNDQIKKGLVLSLFGGTEKFDPECECVHVRDYIHVLLLGSRCSQKNQILKSITSLMNETSCYLVGSCSSLKLIATNTKRRKCLPDEPDAAFICDKKKIICLDELEKMGKLQQQIVKQSIDHKKIGVRDSRGQVAFHPSKVSIIATANLQFAEYHFDKLIEKNTRIQPDLVTTFDLIFLVDNERDNNSKNDLLEYQIEKNRMHKVSMEKAKARKSRVSQASANFESLVELHQSGQLYGGEKILQDDSNELLSLPLIRKYISYCNEIVHPTIDDDLKKNIQQFVSTEILERSEYKLSLLRVYETVCRLIEAHAKLYMRQTVIYEDGQAVLDILEKSMALTKLSLPVITKRANSKKGVLRPKDLYQVICNASSYFKKKRFTVEEIVELSLQYIEGNHDPKVIQNAIYNLNEQALLIKRSDGYEVA